jgi:hypothetical protein
MRLQLKRCCLCVAVALAFGLAATSAHALTVDQHGNKFKGSGSVTLYDPTLSTILYQTTGTLTGIRITAKSNPL